MAETGTKATEQKGAENKAADPQTGPPIQAEEKHVSSASGSNVDINAGKQAPSVSEARAAEAQKEFGAQLTAAEQKAENSKLKLVTPEKGGVATGATGAPIQEGGSGVHGGVI